MSTQWIDYPITHGYITQDQGPGTDTPHYAIDIGTPQDTPLWFIEPGTITIEDQKPWGGEIFLKPDDPSKPEEYFYHLDKFGPYKVGDHVNSGVIVGYSGGQNTGGTMNTDPQWSTGPHTHFGEFTNYVNTAYGSRSYGPDPTDLINIAKANNFQRTTSNPSEFQVGNQLPNPLSGIQGISDFFTQLQANGPRIGFFAIGGLLVLVGVFSLISSSVTSEAKQDVEQLAKVA